MYQDYTLTEKDARLDLLTEEERQQLQDELDERNNDYMESFALERDIEMGYKYNAIINGIARKAGFDGYFKNGQGNSVIDWRDKIQDGKKDERLDLFDRILEESEEYAQFQKEQQQAKADDMTFLVNSTQEMYEAALRIAIPRLLDKNEKWELPSDHKPVILHADNVKSVLLRDNELESIEKGRTMAAVRLDKKVFAPIFTQIHKVKDTEMDNLARKVGFAQFDENEEGTGLRNYTALGKPMSAKIKAQVNEYDKQYNNSPIIRKCLKSFSGLLSIQESMLRALNQVMLRKILAITNERMAHKDAEGLPYLTTAEYLAKRENSDWNERLRFQRPYTTPVHIERNNKKQILHIDKGIAAFVQQLNEAGYVTGQSCSGLLEDHPNARYVDDSKHGLYVKGEPINLNKQGSGTYLTFYKPVDWNDNLVLNNEEQIANILSVAEKEGWIVENMNIFGVPSIRLGLPQTYDGYGKREILHEANDIINKAYPGLYEKEFFKWLDLRSTEVQSAIARHGGVVRWTDDMILQRWQKLTQSLVQAERQRLGIDRISDVRIYVGGDGHWRIKCRIDGEDMLSEHFSDAMMMLKDKGVDLKILAARCYENQLQPQREQDKGLKL